MTHDHRYSEYTLPEVIALQRENHLASRALIEKMRLTVKKKLAKEISLEKFKMDRLEAVELRAALHANHESLLFEVYSRKENSCVQK